MNLINLICLLFSRRLLQKYVKELKELDNKDSIQSDEAPVEQLGRALVDEARLAVVIPGGHAPEAGVSLEQRQRGCEVLEEVGGDLQVVLDNDHLEERIELYYMF